MLVRFYRSKYCLVQICTLTRLCICAVYLHLCHKDVSTVLWHSMKSEICGQACIICLALLVLRTKVADYTNSVDPDGTGTHQDLHCSPF